MTMINEKNLLSHRIFQHLEANAFRRHGRRGCFIERDDGIIEPTVVY